MVKKALVVGIAAAVCVTAASAGPMGPVKPTMGRFSLEGEVASERRDMEHTTTPADKMRAEAVDFVGRISYGLTDKVEVTARLGGADLDVVDRADVAAIGGAVANGSTFDGSSQFAWGLGISAILYDAGTWNLAGNANYFSHADHNGNWGAVTNNDLNYSDWNIGVQAQGKWDQFLPYLGVKYSDARIDFDKINGAARADAESENVVGVYVGTGFDLTPQWSGYVEGRFIEETSFGGGIRYTF